ncbi:hypothetical protein JCM24511_03685 [Saitozyma sp. JCM 24511]|nr:hypothetical protein JCM24511_03685 [Saitozyma sp. JCM 24511]
MTQSSTSLLSPSPSLSLSAAQLALTACLSHASKLGIPVNISIYSSSLHLLAFARMDTAKLTSIDIAHNKAFTAAGHRAPTDTYTKERVGEGGPLYGVGNSNAGRFTMISGGVPVEVEGVCVGAIGVSGGLPSEDKEIALKGVEAILAAIKKQGGTAVKAKL